MQCRLLLFVGVLALLHGSEQTDDFETKRTNARAHLRSLDSETSDNSLVCALRWGQAKRDCKARQQEKRHYLMDRVQQYWHVDHYIEEENGKCEGGFGWFDIDAFNGPVRLPCDEQAFMPPEHTKEETDAMYRTLLKLYNDYDKVCFTTACKEGKEARGLALAKKIKYAEDEGMISRKCQKSGTGWYSFYSGMQEVECPCIYSDPSKTTKTTES